MSEPRRLDLLRDVLDHEIVDADGVACGMVDDIEFVATPDGPAVAALLVGPGAWLTRVPSLVAVIGEWMFGRSRVAVPWERVSEISEVIRLDVKAADLRLGRLDVKVGRWLARLPMS
jgi:sporulation protein YlmC with PRC-barrel domain